MNQLNRKLAPDIESVYVMASPEYSFLSSTGVKELATFGGDVSRSRPRPGRGRSSPSGSSGVEREAGRRRWAGACKPAPKTCRERGISLLIRNLYAH